MRRTQVLAAVVAVLLVTSGTVGLVAGASTAGTAAAGQTAGASAADLGGATPADPTAQPQAGGLVRGSPDLSVTASQPEVTPGQTNELTLSISNNGDMDLGTAQNREVVTTARNVRVTATADNTPLDVETGTLAVGSISDSAPVDAPIAVTVPEGVDEGNYELDVELEYSYTSQQSGDVTYDVERSVTEEVELEVTEDARFRIVNTTTNAQVGDQGTLEAEIENVGASTARDATVSLESPSAGLSLGQGASDTALIDKLEPGETTTVPYDASFTSNAPMREYPVAGTVEFDTPDGVPHVDEGLSAGVTPLGEQEFAVSDVESDLRVGEDGTLSGTVTNDGPVEARSVVVQYAGDAQSVIPAERSTAVGTLDSGESANFSLPLSISGEAESGLRSLDMAVQYRNDEGQARSFENLAVTAEVASERDGFDVAVQNHTIQSGGSRTVEVAVTNNYDETASDVEARLFASAPLETGTTDSGYIQSLSPGETTTMVFDVTAASSAKAGGTYPISFDFRYTDSDGDTHLTDTFRTPLDVESSSGGGLPIVPLLGLGLVVAGSAAFLYRRHR